MYGKSLTRVLSALLVLQLARQAGAAPGDLDFSFGGFGAQGIVTSAGATTAMAVAPDGKLVTVGTSGVQAVVRRYLPNGALDPSFGSGGTATLLNPSYAMNPTAVVVQPDGKIVVAGWASLETDDFLVLRVNANGAIDGSFGSGGYRTTDFSGQSDKASGVVVQPDGMVVVAGTSTVGGDTDFSVARFTTGGSLDPGFSGDGKIVIAFGGDDDCHDVALQEDGKIVVVGDGSDSFPEYDKDVCIARLNPNGTLDNSFGGTGKTTPGLGGYDGGGAVAIQSDGKIVVVGFTDPTDPNGKLARFNPDGTPDTSLDGDGIVSIPNSEVLGDIVIQPDGGMLVLGEANFRRWLAVYRRLPNGAADPTFDGDGSEFFDFGSDTFGRHLALLPDNRILAHGATGTSTEMVRLWPDGSLDLGGRQMVAFDETGIPQGSGFPPGSLERVNGMAIQSDGKIVVAGAVVHPVSGESDFALARFTPDGELDTSFGTLGHVSFSFHNDDVATAVAIQPDGKIVVAGYEGSGFGINFLLARFWPSGTLDNTFGFGGFNVIDFAGWDDYAHAVAIAPDGKVVLAGAAFDGTHYVFGVVRFTSEGVADYSFDGDARQLVDFGSGLFHDGRSMIVQPDRKIVVGGGVGGDFGLARLNENGSLDNTFGCQGGGGGGGICSGRARIDMGGYDQLFAIARAPNGWLYAAGATGTGPVDAAVAQFNENGRLASCPPFPCENWPTGKAYLDWGSLGAAYALDVRSDGQILVAGEADGIFQWAQFGPTSPTSTITGSVDLVGSREFVTTAKFIGSSKLVLAGHQGFNGDENFALASFETTPTASVDVPAPALPAGTVVEALGPNPSHGSTSLTFVLAEAARVEVGVYDVSGRLIRTMDKGLLQTGRHQATWDGRGSDGVRIGAGVFFVSLQIEGRPIGNRRLVLLR